MIIKLLTGILIEFKNIKSIFTTFLFDVTSKKKNKAEINKAEPLLGLKRH